MMWFVVISPVQWLRIYNNVSLYHLSADSSYTTYSLWPSSIQNRSTTERLLITQNNKTTTPLCMLAQEVTCHACILGYVVPITFDAPTIHNEVSVDSLSPFRWIPSHYLQLFQLDFLPSHCHLYSRRHTTADERALNLKINKTGNGRPALSSLPMWSWKINKY